MDKRQYFDLGVAPSFAESVAKAFIVMSLPAAELILLRWYLHSVANIRLGFSYVTDFDFLLPVPLAFMLVMYVLERVGPCILSLKRKWILLNSGFVILFLVVNHASGRLASWVLFSLIWDLLLFSVILTAFCCFVAPSFYVKNPNRFVLVPALVIAFCVVLEMNFFSSIWRHFAPVLTASVGWLAKAALGGHITAFMEPEGMLRINHPQLSLLLGKGCAGMSGFLFFSMVYLIFLVLKYNNKQFSRWLLGYVSGLLLMHLINTLRIVLFFVAGIWLKNLLGEETGTRLFEMLFHTHLGWLLYSAGIIIHLSLFRSFLAPLKTIELSESPRVLWLGERP